MIWPLRLGLLALVLMSYWGTYQHGRSVERGQALAASAQRDSGERLAEALGQRDARQEEQRRAQAQEEARAHAYEQHQVADAGAAGADAAGQRLQHDAAQLAATVSCPGTDTAAVARGQAATRAAMVLSDLLSRSVATNRELAQAYDRARIAGKQCEQEYEALLSSK
ncbi:DUF2514 domain-containing protein [Pseudomonas alloputida]|uniref:DUF2514 domain-containing protein n=1 Tax=Pseudomonas alloputida TaxID=1940621 RepID=A0AAW7HQE5_9PSED|nr:DUF2514 domain-containing protein [Pseudomonas alloputida]MCE0863416.1 DUF2514 domain-containing protein [Pseudomonas alloputida]MCE0892484.1 DUF2514 domain-containing protein [Pseudomonas alloputida]MCE0921501.1 DUF2514 domain-containing protein [Pseudomonas alloputida]MCE1048716.1 DUF2514 domain-containing protein [Pseudomonas alloputida]MCE1128278.1 DUF2514 domain-containing protein [Pseudomonas alloputida]